MEQQGSASDLRGEVRPRIERPRSTLQFNGAFIPIGNAFTAF
jgi:hypothetical protein